MKPQHIPPPSSLPLGGRVRVVIRPQVGRIGAGDFDRRHETILEGEKAAARAIPQIRQILDRLRQEGRLP